MRLSSLTTAALCTVLAFSSCSNKKKASELTLADTTAMLYYEFHDFESIKDSRIDTTKGLSGKSCALVNADIEYGSGFEKQFQQIASFKSLEEVNVTFNCWMDKKYPEDVFVLSIDDTINKKNLVWEARAIEPAKMNEWSPVSINYKINQAFVAPENVVKLYIWNKGKNTFYFDDLALSFVKLKK